MTSTSHDSPFARTDALLRALGGVRVVVVGGGRTGAASARLLLRMGAHVAVLDDAADDKVRTGLDKGGLTRDLTIAAEHDGVFRVFAGGIAKSEVDAAELIVLSPGVPRAHPSIAPALAAGKPCINEVELAAAVLAKQGVRPRVIGITGTNGKSTTTTMCGAIAKAADAHAFVGGNLGTPYCQCALDVLDGKRAPQFAVLELSSYQLETIAHLKFAAAVVTNLTPDHLDRYPSAAAYYAAKARLLALVEDGGGISLNAADPASDEHLAPIARSQGARARCDFDVSIGMEGVSILEGPARRLVVQRGSKSKRRVVGVVAVTNPNIVGHHNRQNAAAAVAGACLAGIPRDAWQRGLDAYAGIAHRLERVGEKHGVAWFNDSKGTNVDATVTAVKSFAGGIHLIAGGKGKGAPYAPLVDVSRDKVVAVYTIGEDAALIEAAYKEGAPKIEVVPSGTIDVACANASSRAKPGDVILLSPACASFDQFRDYAHRGETFRALFAGKPASSASSSSGAH